MGIRHHTDQPDHAAAQSATLIEILGAVTNGNDTMTQIVRGMKTSAGIRQMGMNPSPIRLVPSASPTYTAGQLISTSPGLLLGVNFRETSGSDPCLIQIYDGIDPLGKLLWTELLPVDGASLTELFGQGISFGAGLYIQASGGPQNPASPGNVEGVLYRNGGHLPTR